MSNEKLPKDVHPKVRQRLREVSRLEGKSQAVDSLVKELVALEIIYLPDRIKKDKTAKEIAGIIRGLPKDIQQECRLTLDMLLFMYNLCSSMIAILTQLETKGMKNAAVEVRRTALLKIADKQAIEHFGERNPVIPPGAMGQMSKHPGEYCPYYFQEIGWKKALELWNRQKNQLTVEDKKNLIKNCFNSTKGFLKTVRAFETWRRSKDWTMKAIINDWLEKETNNSVFIAGDNLPGQQQVKDEVAERYKEYSKEDEKFLHMWSEIIVAIANRKDYSLNSEKLLTYTCLQSPAIKSAMNKVLPPEVNWNRAVADFINRIAEVITYAKGTGQDEDDVVGLPLGREKAKEEREDRIAILEKAIPLMQKDRFSLENLEQQIQLVDKKMSKYHQQPQMRAIINSTVVKKELKRRARGILRDEEADLAQVKLSKVDAALLAHAYLRDLKKPGWKEPA
jgi:5'-3' exonuclease